MKKLCSHDTLVPLGRYRSQAVRQRSAKPLCVGAIPTGTSKKQSPENKGSVLFAEQPKNTYNVGTMKRLVLFDGNAIIHRGYHAIPPLTTKAGVMVNAVYGFAAMLLRVWAELKPDYVAVTFDMKGPTSRNEKFVDYKATGVKADQELYDQIPLVHRLVEAFNIPIFEKQGYEADDVIGTVVEQFKDDQDLETYIITGDKDTLQLVTDQVKVFALRKGINDTVVYDRAEVNNRFGFGPEHVVDFKALAGDSSDNIPGVPGVGEKTATGLIQQFGGIEKIYQAVKAQSAEELGMSASVYKKLVDGEASARMSFELATIHRSVPEVNVKLADCVAKDFDLEKVKAIFQEFEFFSLLKRVPGLEGEMSGKMKNKKTTTNKKAATAMAREEVQPVTVGSISEAEELVVRVRGEKKFGMSLLNPQADVLSSEVPAVVLVVQEEAFRIPDIRWCVSLLGLDEVEMIGHDLKKIIKAAHRHGVSVKNKLFDVMVASYLLNPGSRTHDIPSILFKSLGKTISGEGGQNSLFGADAGRVGVELQLLLAAAEGLRAELKTNNNEGLFQKIEMPVLSVLANMELNGMAVDKELLDKLSHKVAEDVAAATATIYALAGKEFNISSPLQLRDILFDTLNISVEGIKKGKTGLSTASAELEKMRGLHPIIEAIETYRELTKLQNTYIDVLPNLINKNTGRIHTTFNQTVAATGRLSSSDPNMQNIPVRTELGREIRKAFIAEPGNILVSADYSQIELRIVASLAKDEKMMQIFADGLDIHRATAAAINNVPLAEVTKEMRYGAKEVNFGVLYGMGSYGLSSRTGITHWQAKEFIEKYFQEFKGVKKYIEETLAFTRQEGFCETLFGRRRYIPELASKNFQLRAMGERMAVNHPIQGTAADLMKMAMIAVAKKIEGNKDVRMILQVHDELVFEVTRGKEKEVGDMVKETMEQVVILNVPVLVDVHANGNWGEIK